MISQHTYAARLGYHVSHPPTHIAHLLALHESFPPLFGGQVARWTQRKCQAENLVGGGLAAWGSSAKSNLDAINSVSIKASPNGVHHVACQVSPFCQVHLTVRYALPDPKIGVVAGIGSEDNKSPRHLPQRPSARGHATTKRSKKRNRRLAPPPALFFSSLAHYPQRRVTPPPPYSLFLAH